MCEKYNGWYNYPTWNVKLWIDNDEKLSDSIISMIQEKWNSAEADRNHTKEEMAIMGASEALQEWVEGYKEVVYAARNGRFGMLFDLLEWAIEMVDWFELAQAFIDDNVDKS